ncbi:MAG TPA: electron transport complex subunit RsxC [Clostridiales bacterium]|nr:electron transport complex subunit RsxC [Clostridiales bacterium]
MLFKLTFKRGGIHPKDMKELAKDSAFEEMPTGAKVYIPLVQHIGAPCTPSVQVGDYVKVGQNIGLANGYVSANIHSSVSGKVLGFEARENAAGKRVRHIVIENDYKYDEVFFEPLENPTKEEIILRCKEAGIVGMGGATFPTHVKLEPKTPIKALIINGSECEPYITTDYRLMLEKPVEILKGVDLVKKALDTKQVFFGIESNKGEAIKNIIKHATDEQLSVFELKTKYPQGGEKQLIYALTKESVPNGGLPSDIGYIVLNVSTCLALYEAVCLGKSSYSRYLTVSGKGIKRPANLHVRIGVPYEEVVEYLGGTNEFVKIISGGPMMGVSMHNLKTVVSKGSSAILLLTEKEIRDVSPTPCIGCGRCARACPMNLMPMLIDDFILHNRVDDAKAYYAMSCIECGCCAYVCPAKRPLVQSQRLAKKLIREKDMHH